MEGMLFLLIYLTFSILTIWGLIKMAERRPQPPSDDDDDGGIPYGGLPIIDVPPGGSVEDLLVDRIDNSPVITNKEYH